MNNKNLLSLFNSVNFDIVQENNKKNSVPKSYVKTLNKEMASIGYSLKPKLIEKLTFLSKENFLKVRENLLLNMLTLSGFDKQFNVLFNNFPYEVPEQKKYLEDRIINHIRNMEGNDDLKISSNHVLSCGHVIDNNVFDLNSFGACPICQLQVDELETSSQAKYTYKNITPLKMVGYISNSGLKQKAESFLVRNSSLNQIEKDFLNELIAENKISLDKPKGVIYKENLPFLFSINSEWVKDNLSGATDILRIAAYVSNLSLKSEINDVSLSSERVRFKLTTSNKKKLLSLLNDMNLSSLEEDMLRYREIWLRMGEVINPCSLENKAKYPNVAKAFDRLRNQSKLIETFNRYVSNLTAKIDINKNQDDTDMIKLVNLLSSRPGEFLRKLDYMLRKTHEDETHAIIYTNLETILNKVDTKIIFETIKYFSYRETKHEKRVFYPKGQVNKVQILDDNREDIDPNVLKSVIFYLKNELTKRLEKESNMGLVYVDPSLMDIIIPFNQRGDSKTTTPTVKGSKYALNDKASNIRLFIYWKDGSSRTDVDLSVNCYDENFKLSRSVSFSNLSDKGLKHSGDIQGAPKGASEFLDCDISVLRKTGVRYIIPNVISYTGQTFDSFECFSGYMERDKLTSGKHFEPTAVKFKFDLNSPNTTHMPIAFDVLENKVIFIDMPSAIRAYSTTVANSDKFVELLKATLDLPLRKPTVYDVLFENVNARGKLVKTPSEADVVYNLDNFDMEEILKLMKPEEWINSSDFSFKKSKI
jgi:hypothetical protein